MGLDIQLEAEEQLTEAFMNMALQSSGFSQLNAIDGNLATRFPSGMWMTFSRSDDERLRANNTLELRFHVAARCNFRIKGPEHPDYSSMDELHALLASIASVCNAKFIVSFQYESILYWRDDAGLHDESGTRIAI